MTSVLHVVTDTDRRGAQVFAEVLHRHLDGGEVSVRTVALTSGSTSRRIEADVLGPSRLSVSSLRRLRRSMSDCDVCVGFGSTTLVASTIAGLGVGVPFIYFSIGESAYWTNTRSRRLRVGAQLRRADAVVVHWEAAARDLVGRYGLAPERFHVIPRGVEAVRFPQRSIDSRRQHRRALGVDVDARVIVAVGALSDEKNLESVILAVAQLPDVVLVLAGAGPDEERLRFEAERRAPGRVQFLGAVDDVVGVYHAADVLVLASKSEGMPGVVIEAGMCGIPVVATAVGAVPEMVVDALTGYVVPADVSSVTLAERLDDAIDHSLELGAAMRARCLEKYEVGVVARQWMDMATSVAGSLRQ
ncbi:MAG TPA: hypothetical protein DCS55_15045 [Acidimicrobiaceae bacterium]|nr:hypothetical protein [Acidimicrobiaceae bacterium]